MFFSKLSSWISTQKTKTKQHTQTTQEQNEKIKKRTIIVVDTFVGVCASVKSTEAKNQHRSTVCAELRYSLRDIIAERRVVCGRRKKGQEVNSERVIRRAINWIVQRCD